MKKIFVFFAIVISFANVTGQNVGIGTTTPSDKLSVVNTAPGYGITHAYGPVVMGTYISDLNGQFGTKTNHPLQFFTNNGAAQVTLLPNGNVGIGTTSPGFPLHVAGLIGSTGNGAGFFWGDRINANQYYSWTSAGGSVFLHDYLSLRNVMTVSPYGKIGFSVDDPQADLHVNPFGASGSILIGTDKYSGGYTNLEMGITSSSDGNSYIQSTKASGSTWGTLALNPSGGDVTVAGYVGIGTNTPFSPLDIIQPQTFIAAIRMLSPGHIWGLQNNSNSLVFMHNGSTRATINANDGTYTSFSDRRLKKNISGIGPVLEKVLQLAVKQYQFIDTDEPARYSTGFISQDVTTLFPELVSECKRNEKDTTLYLGINYAGFSVIAIKAIQEQQSEIDLLKQQLSLMKTEIEKLKQK